MRILLFTGKGGVGKTTVAAATALRAAQLGHRTLIISTDIAHSLADALDTPLNNTPKAIGSTGLHAAELDTMEELEQHWGDMKRKIAGILKEQGMDATIAGELAVVPGLDEILSLVRIQKIFSAAEYDLLVIDSAPTGAAMRLLSAPDLNQFYFPNLSDLTKGLGRLIKPSLSILKKLPFSESEIRERFKELITKVEKLHEILITPEITSVRLVLNPERMALLETERAFTYFALYGLNVDGILVNRIIPQQVVDPYLDSWKESQARYSEKIQKSFAPLPVFEIPLLNKEIIGAETLAKLSLGMYGERDPALPLCEEKPLQFNFEDDKYIVKLRIVGVSGKEIDLQKEGDTLKVKVGKFSRSIALPKYISGLNPSAATMDGKQLTIIFPAK